MSTYLTHGLTRTGIKDMAKQTDKSDQQYRSLRDEFDNLQLEEKAVFLIESGLSLFIHGIESLTHFVRDEVNKMTEDDKEPEKEADSPATKKEEAPKKKTRSTATKRKTTRSTTSRRKTPPKEDAASKDEDKKKE